MKKSELIKALQEIEGDFEIKIKVPTEYAMSVDRIMEGIAYPGEEKTITLYSE